MDLKCIVCNNATKLQCKCGVLYCSSECQKANWMLHKSECVAMCKLRSHFDELSALVAKGGRSEASHLVNLAECYASGFGCVANKSRAVELFEEAATNHDDVGSMVRLGEMAESSDRKEAEKWFRSAANRDDPKGQLSLAELLLQNDQAVEARKWLRAASDAGEVLTIVFFVTLFETFLQMQALSRLGYCLINGIGGDCDEKAGMSMMLEAAEKDAGIVLFVVFFFFLK
jgi:TPR repeat protein